jgi:hypothetical protein
VLPKHRKTLRLNHKLTVEEDLEQKKILPTWITPPEQNGTHKGRNHKMKNSKDVD